LSSWGIEMPPPPPGRHRGPKPELDEATKTQLDSLKAQYDAASTDEEKEVLRERIRELFRSSRSDDEKKGVRRFFKDHPSKGEKEGDRGTNGHR
ncbi:MAG TPA: hypothetical protein PL182_09580, partial [Pseudobdellovibrionaceae bacterium]|nr:hypothetical protein [Pseudobdellovibrionaceae bacterium]